MTDITIPPEAVEAAARAICETFRAAMNMPNEPEWDASNPTLKDAYRNEARAALRAGIAAWPGSYSLAENDSAVIRDVAAIILPLPQEASDE